MSEHLEKAVTEIHAAHPQLPESFDPTQLAAFIQAMIAVLAALFGPKPTPTPTPVPPKE